VSADNPVIYAYARDSTDGHRRRFLFDLAFSHRLLAELLLFRISAYGTTVVTVMLSASALALALARTRILLLFHFPPLCPCSAAGL
jgi:hypothetical protein